MSEVDRVEVHRAAHELVVRHGAPAAKPYAEKLAKRAEEKGDIDERDFRDAVALSLTVR